MNYADALRLVGGLSRPSKMPWYSWSIDASTCITGSKLAQHENTVCSSCYALKGNYVFSNVKNAQARRLAGSEDPRFVEAFVIVLEKLYKGTRKRRENGDRENRFRWFDAGDLQSTEMLIKINEIAKRTPYISHWLPTREMGFVSDFLAFHEPSTNLTIRLSAPVIGQVPKSRTLGLPFATVGSQGMSNAYECQAAAKQGNQCLECDRCWDVRNDVNYPLH